MTVVSIADIHVNGGTQSRAQIDRSVVAEYAEAICDGATFPPIVLFFDGSAYWLGDGFHRYEAYATAQRDEVPADVRQGTRRDAILFSVGANALHGLRRTNDDKRRAVLTLLNDPEWSAWSAREIARACGVSHDFAARLKREVSSDDTGRNSPPVRLDERAPLTTSADDGGREALDKAHIAPATSSPIEASSTAAVLPDPLDPERRKLAKLAPEFLIDDIIGLRADLADSKAREAALKTENESLKSRLAEATSGDMGRALGNAQRRAETASARMNEHMRANKKLEFRLNKAEARVKELEAMPVSMA